MFTNTYMKMISSYSSSRALRDFNARSFKADKRTHIFCFVRATVNTERNEIKRKVNRWRARAPRGRWEGEGERERGGEKFAAGNLATRIPSRSIIRDASGFSDASWGKYSHCEITRFYTKSLYRGAIYHPFNARVIERSRSARDPTSCDRIRISRFSSPTRVNTKSRERKTCMYLHEHTFENVFFMLIDPITLQSRKTSDNDAPLCQFKQCHG